MKKKNKKTNKIWAFVILAVIALVVYSFVANNNKAVENNSKSVRDGMQFDSEYYARILLEEAERQNITVSDIEVNETIKGLVEKSNMTEEAYFEYLSQIYPDMNEFNEKLISNLKIIKLINQEVDWSRIDVSNETVDRFVEENKDSMPVDKLESDPDFKAQFYAIMKQQMFEQQKQELINEYVLSLAEG